MSECFPKNPIDSVILLLERGNKNSLFLPRNIPTSSTPNQGTKETKSSVCFGRCRAVCTKLYSQDILIKCILNKRMIDTPTIKEIHSNLIKKRPRSEANVTKCKTPK